MAEDDEISNIVIDPGSFAFKAGFAGYDAPGTVFPSVLGSKRFLDQDEINIRDSYIGHQAQEKRDLLSLRYPIKNGIVTNWDDMETLLRHSYGQLKTDPEKHPVLLAEPPLNPKSNKECFAELMFETMDIPALTMKDSSYLCLYSCGRNSGVMINVGDGVAFAVPFYESHCMSHGIQRQDFAGHHLTQFLQKRLNEKGLSYTTTSEFEIVRDMKEKLGYIALDFDIETSRMSGTNDLKTSYVLSEGISVGFEEERFHCPELLFQPSLFGFHGVKGIPDMVYEAIQSCELNTRGDIVCNLIVSGGCVKFPGFKDRLEKEMRLRLPPTIKVRVSKCVDAAHHLAVWIGGSIYASLSTSQPYLIPKSTYEEYGPSIVHKLFPSS